MPLEILLGKSKSGKSKYIYDKIDEDIANLKDVVLFVPSQSRIIAEEDYMNMQKKLGIIGVDITTISEYIVKKLKSTNFYFEENYINDIDKKTIISKVILENLDDFKIFNKVKNREGFLESLKIYIDLFRKENLDSKLIDELKLDDKLLECKLKEINNIYAKYVEEIDGKYTDDVTSMQIYINRLLLNKQNNKELYVYFDGYNNFSQSEYLFIRTLLEININVIISITTDITNKEEVLNNKDNSIFSISNNTYLKLLNIAHNLGLNVNTNIFYNNYQNSKADIKYLSDNIFGDISSNKVDASNVSIKLTSNLNSEIESVAKYILEKVKVGNRYRDFVVYTSNIEEYSHIISKIFYEYNIPVYLDMSQTISNNLLIQYISKLIDIACFGMTNDNIFEILKLGLSQILLEDVNYIENYVLEFNISKYSWDKEFNLNNTSNNDVIYDLERINDIRKMVVNIFLEVIKNLNKKMTSQEIIKVIYLHLEQNNVIKKYEEYTTELENSNNPDLIYIASINEQIWDKLCEIFNSINKVFNQEKLNIKDFKAIFNYTIKDVNLKAIPPTLDQVSVLDINLSKINSKKYVIIIGVNENKFPKKVEDDVFFSDTEIKYLDDNDIKFKETSISKLNMQLYNIYQALNVVLDELVIYIPVSDNFSKSLRPSSIITDIMQILNLKIEGNVVANNDMGVKEFKSIRSKQEGFDYMVGKLNEIEANGEFNCENIKAMATSILELNTLYKYFLTKEEYFDIINYVKNDDNLSDNTINKLYSNEFNTSISKLELFRKCPFSYYMNYVLKLKPRKEFNVTSLEIGSFMHSVIEKFSLFLFEQAINWQELLIDSAEKKYNWKEKLYSIIQTELDYEFKKHKDSIKYVIMTQKLKNTLLKVVLTIAKSFNQSEFKPLGYEIEFKKSGLFAPIHMELGNDQNMYVIGKIDRVDILELEAKKYIRVIDYKSSSRDLKIEDIKEGISLQLISYLYALMENMDKENQSQVIPTAMLYFNLSDKLINLKNYTKDKTLIEKELIKSLRMKGIFLKDITIIEKMDNKINTDDRLIDISARSITGSSSKKVLEQDEYIKICKEAKEILKEIGSEVLSGIVKIKPNNKHNACKYCKFSNICRKNSCV